MSPVGEFARVEVELPDVCRRPVVLRSLREQPQERTARRQVVESGTINIRQVVTYLRRITARSINSVQRVPVTSEQTSVLLVERAVTDIADICNYAVNKSLVVEIELEYDV